MSFTWFSFWRSSPAWHLYFRFGAIKLVRLMFAIQIPGIWSTLFYFWAKEAGPHLSWKSVWCPVPGVASSELFISLQPLYFWFRSNWCLFHSQWRWTCLIHLHQVQNDLKLLPATFSRSLPQLWRLHTCGILNFLCSWFLPSLPTTWNILETYQLTRSWSSKGKLFYELTVVRMNVCFFMMQLVDMRFDFSSWFTRKLSTHDTACVV